jgi:hypothetical protein
VLQGLADVVRAKAVRLHDLKDLSKSLLLFG